MWLRPWESSNRGESKVLEGVKLPTYWPLKIRIMHFGWTRTLTRTRPASARMETLTNIRLCQHVSTKCPHKMQHLSKSNKHIEHLPFNVRVHTLVLVVHECTRVLKSYCSFLNLFLGCLFIVGTLWHLSQAYTDRNGISLHCLFGKNHVRHAQTHSYLQCRPSNTHSSFSSWTALLISVIVNQRPAVWGWGA